MVQESDILQISPPIGLESFFNGKLPKLWCVGDHGILNGRLLGIISARKFDRDLAEKSTQLLQQLAALKDVPFISGWHSPLEKEALRILSGKSAQIVFCVAKSLNRFVPPAEIDNPLQQGRALLLTHCSPKAKRISREASLRRNQLVAALAEALLIFSAPKGSSSFELAKASIEMGKPVLTIHNPMNSELFDSGAMNAILSNFEKALRMTHCINARVT